jgi:hypothetical protein
MTMQSATFRTSPWINPRIRRKIRTRSRIRTSFVFHALSEKKREKNIRIEGASLAAYSLISISLMRHH